MNGDGTSSIRELIERNERGRHKRHFHLGLNPYHQDLPEVLLAKVPAKDETVRLSFIGSIRAGGLYRDARCHITPQIQARIDPISRGIHGFHLVWYDIRFKFVEGPSNMELNGSGAEPLDIWDPEMRLREAYIELFRYQPLLVEISAKNIRPDSKLCPSFAS